MDLVEVKTLANLYIEEHLDNGWSFQWSNGLRVFGVCKYSKKQIRISQKLASINSIKEVEKVIIHEVAHAYVGRGHGHDYIWKRTCLKLGGDGKRCWTTKNGAKAIEFTYTIYCPTCGTSYGRYRRPRKVNACAKCCDERNDGRFTSKYLFEVKRN